MKNLIRILLSPSCWTRIHPTNMHWDKKFNELLDKHEFKIIDKYTAVLGAVPLWIKNLPFACFETEWDGEYVMPSRKTVFKAMDKLKPKLDEYTLQEFEKRFM